MSKYWLLVPLLVVYLSSLGRVGFLGPDEPRYASIGREMARSGDWVTPRLDGSPWFEKPPLLYWMIGAGHKLHLAFPGNDEWAARLPLALASLAFLWFFHRTLAREFSPRVALAATGILATSAGWVAYSFASVTDLPMSAALGAATLIGIFGPSAIPSRAREPVVLGIWAGVLLGLAVLAKGFVPLVLIAPVLLIARRMRQAMLASCAVIAAPWYILCAVRNGSVFWNEFFWKHHVDRFLHTSLEHVQPLWYYLPVLLAGLFPWTPLAGLLFRPRTYQDERIRFLVFWMLFGLAFFSAAQNKLPGYVLPLLPALAIVLAVALDKTPAAGWWIGVCVVLLIAAPAIVALLPDALLSGVTSAHFSFARLARGWPFALAAAGVFWLAWLSKNEPGKRQQAIIAATLASLAAVAYFKFAVLPVLDQRYSVRGFWRANAAQIETGACLKDVRREWTYGLNYYTGHPLPECSGTMPQIAVRDGQLTMTRP
ncbi:MAG: glycosyltransferase family 39 protein [Acidobacteriia bacterium]|nr:glycosyltransferase family 39 protein [Terriglobia bacterium]